MCCIVVLQSEAIYRTIRGWSATRFGWRATRPTNQSEQPPPSTASIAIIIRDSWVRTGILNTKKRVSKWCGGGIAKSAPLGDMRRSVINHVNFTWTNIPTQKAGWKLESKLHF
jgi:hypothetical protein